MAKSENLEQLLKMIESSCIGREHPMRTNCTARRPHLTLEDTVNKTILLIDLACPNEDSKEQKGEEKSKK